MLTSHASHHHRAESQDFASCFETEIRTVRNEQMGAEYEFLKKGLGLSWVLMETPKFTIKHIVT